LTLGPNRWPELRGLFKRLQDRGGPKVLSTIASSIHELAKILDPKQVAEDLLPVYTRLIDSKDDIRERVFEHIDEFVAGLPAELAWMTFLGLGEAWKCDTLGGWRAREAVALHLPAFLGMLT
jgi:serine/threonine-protein phosphatase 4 regulatory subunit 1